MFNSKLGIIVRNYLTIKVDSSYSVRADKLVRKAINRGTYIAEDDFTVLVDLKGVLIEFWIANRFYSYLTIARKFSKKGAGLVTSCSGRKYAVPLRPITIYDGERPSRKTCIDFTEWLFSQKHRIKAHYKGCVAGAYVVSKKEWKDILFDWNDLGIPVNIPSGYRGFV